LRFVNRNGTNDDREKSLEADDDVVYTIRYDTIEEFAEYSALSTTRSQKKKLKQTT